MLQGRVWPDLEPEAAAKRLRQLLWRVRTATAGRLLDVSMEQVRLADHVEVDLYDAERFARRAMEHGSAPPAEHAVLGRELLADWQDGTVLDAQERWNRLRLMALERLAEESLRAGAVLDAIEFAGMATMVDEFDEIPRRIMVSAYSLRGDHAGARRVYDAYRRLLRTELGLEPSPEFKELLSRNGDMSLKPAAPAI